MYMPATRDLSEQKMTTLKNWLNNPSMDTARSPLAATANVANPIDGVEVSGNDDLARMTRIKGGFEHMDAQD
jgi:hypothetical protein